MKTKWYVLEGTVPRGFPEPGLFQQSMGWVDKDGNGIRYQTIYFNELYGLKECPRRHMAAVAAARGQGGGRRGGGNQP